MTYFMLPCLLNHRFISKTLFYSWQCFMPIVNCVPYETLGVACIVFVPRHSVMLDNILCPSWILSHTTRCTLQGGEAIGCLDFRSHFPPKIPIIIGSFAKNDLQLKASYASSPPCMLCALSSQIVFHSTLYLVLCASSWNSMFHDIYVCMHIHVHIMLIRIYTCLY